MFWRKKEKNAEPVISPVGTERLRQFEAECSLRRRDYDEAVAHARRLRDKMKDRTESIKLTDGQLADEHASLDRAISKAKRARERLELSRKKMLALDLIEDTRKGVMDRHPPCPVEEIEELQIDHRMALDREEAFDEAVKRLERDRAASDGKEDPVVEDDLSLDSPAVERQRESRVSDEDLQKL